jgi:hypothetical protein
MIHLIIPSLRFFVLSDFLQLTKPHYNSHKFLDSVTWILGKCASDAKADNSTKVVVANQWPSAVTLARIDASLK